MVILDLATALNNQYLGSNAATPEQQGDVHVLEFANSPDQFAEFLLYLPDYYAGGGLTFEITGMAKTATSGNYAWEIAISSLTPGSDNPGSKSFSAVNSSGAVATDATAGEITEATVTFTNGADMDSWAAGEWAKVRINRDVGVASNLSGIFQFLGLVVKETGT